VHIGHDFRDGRPAPPRVTQRCNSHQGYASARVRRTVSRTTQRCGVTRKIQGFQTAEVGDSQRLIPMLRLVPVSGKLHVVAAPAAMSKCEHGATSRSSRATIAGRGGSSRSAEYGLGWGVVGDLRHIASDIFTLAGPGSQLDQQGRPGHAV